MSRPASLSLSAGIEATDALCLLQQRLLMTEKEAAAPIQDLAAIGISRDQIVTSAETKDATQQPLSPLKIHQIQGDEKMLWQQCGSLVNRVYHMESLLQTLKLAILRLETEGGLDSSQKGNDWYI